MRVIIALIFIVLSFIPYTFAKDIDIGVSISNGKLRSFYFSLSDFYRIPEEKIIIIKKKYHIIDDELPVILLIIREVNIDPDIIIQLRKRGYSWYDIMIRFGLYPEVVFRGYLDYGPPYGKAWGYHKKPKKIKFKDQDIIILSNIKFLSEYYRESPEIIIKYKEKYQKFIDVHDEIYKQKRSKREKIENSHKDRINENFNGKTWDRERNWEREQRFDHDGPGKSKGKIEKDRHEWKSKEKPTKERDDTLPGWQKKMVN